MNSRIVGLLDLEHSLQGLSYDIAQITQWTKKGEMRFKTLKSGAVERVGLGFGA